MAFSFHLAQVNVARMLAPLTDPVMAGFVARLAEINRLAESSPGFVWRLTEEANPFDADVLFNLSLWESPDALKQFVYRTSHKELLAAREEWFQRFDGPYVALWWIPAGAVPSITEARARLEHLREHGDSHYAFRFQSEFAKAAVA
jgi:heme-degrading monooxygenase HmoA